MCREKEEAAEAHKIGQYVLFEYCLTRNCRSGEDGKMGRNKTRLIMVSANHSPAHTATYCRIFFFLFFFDWLCKKQTKKTTAAADIK